MLATLYALRQDLGFAPSDTAEDPRLLSCLTAATALIESGAGRRFRPVLATRLLSIDPRSSTEIALDADLLTLQSVTHGSSESIALDQLLVLAGRLVLINGQTFRYATSPQQAVSVTGIWGAHDDWSHAWRVSGDTVQDAPLSSTAAAITVTDADGTDAAGVTPRFQVGQIVRIESEYLSILAMDADTNVLTVQRGQHGTVGAAHVQGSAISIYQPPHAVENLCLRVAAWLYREPNTVNGTAMPPMLTAGLSMLRRVRVR
jgi:hypothetical protein